MCQYVFDKIKRVISSEPVLKLLNFTKTFEMYINALDYVLGSVLVQERHPITFESKKLKDAEQRYSSHEKEMTFVVYCLDT